MWFKLKSTKITISFSFLLFFLICSLNDKLELYVETLSVCLIHETIHIIFILYFKDEISEISFNIFGGKIEKANKVILSNNAEAIINLSAPVFNFVLGIVTLVFYGKTQWGDMNIFIGMFNLLPFFNFDGGRGLFFLLSKKADIKTAERILYLISFAMLLIFIAISVISYYHHNINYVFIIMSLYMGVSLFLFKNL